MLFEECINCGMKVLKGKRDENGFFCSTKCQRFYRHPEFCQVCISATSDKSAGKTYTLNGIGTQLYFEKDVCPHCESIIQTKFICFWFMPLIPIGKYRVKWMSQREYLSRKII
jgi:hypothetical protein